MSKENTADRVAQLISPVVESLGCSLWDVVYAKEGADYHLTVTIDKKGGVTIDDCEMIHHAIDPILDEADPIEESYYLDVSSPGIERQLRTPAHLLASVGQKCEARLFAPFAGKRIVRGILSAFDGVTLTLEAEDSTQSLPMSSISKIKTIYFE